MARHAARRSTRDASTNLRTEAGRDLAWAVVLCVLIAAIAMRTNLASTVTGWLTGSETINLSGLMALVLLVPQAVLLLGIVFASIDLGAGLGEALPLVLPILVSTVVAAAFFSGVGLVIAAFIPRRAFSAGAIVATFLVLSGVVQILVVRGELRDPFRYVALFDPYALLDGLASDDEFDLDPEPGGSGQTH